MPLMQLGSFVFSVPTYSFESMKRQTSGRAEGQQVIGAAPPTHLLGPGDETMDLESTFFPYHLNGGGLAQLEGVRQAVRDQDPLMLVGFNGLVYGRWVIKELNDEHTFFHPVSGIAQQITVGMSLLKYNGGIGAAQSSWFFF